MTMGHKKHTFWGYVNLKGSPETQKNCAKFILHNFLCFVT